VETNTGIQVNFYACIRDIIKIQFRTECAAGLVFEIIFPCKDIFITEFKIVVPQAAIYVEFIA
jgi:hypothetical protein